MKTLIVLSLLAFFASLTVSMSAPKQPQKEVVVAFISGNQKLLDKVIAEFEARKIPMSMVGSRGFDVRVPKASASRATSLLRRIRKDPHYKALTIIINSPLKTREQ